MGGEFEQAGSKRNVETARTDGDTSTGLLPTGLYVQTEITLHVPSGLRIKVRMSRMLLEEGWNMVGKFV